MITEQDTKSTIDALQMLYRGSVAAVLVYDWALNHTAPQHHGELMAIRDLHHSCQTLLATKIRQLGGDPSPDVLSWAMSMLAHIGDTDTSKIRDGLMGCERSGWRACNESFDHVTCEVRCFLEDEVRARLEETLARMTELFDRLQIVGN